MDVVGVFTDLLQHEMFSNSHSPRHQVIQTERCFQVWRPTNLVLT